MKLDVLKDVSDKLWYADGLQFTCSQCGNCCTGGPGFVWVTKTEIERLAAFLQITPEETVEQYCRKIDGRISLNEVRHSQGAYDCVFLKDIPASRGSAGGKTDRVTQTKRGCSIYPVRPLQCRTWPFWPENLSNKKIWDNTAKKCHGMNQGRQFTTKQIHTIRDAKDWPQNPPTSGKPTSDK
jgi:Fe-S-cluster containining protein